jgi:hypothetical protein
VEEEEEEERLDYKLLASKNLQVWLRVNIIRDRKK